MIDLLVGGATRREIRDRIDAIKGKPKARRGDDADAPASAPKPKRVYHTKYHATVIVQSEGETLTTDQCMGTLQEAMGVARDSGGFGIMAVGRTRRPNESERIDGE